MSWIVEAFLRALKLLAKADGVVVAAAMNSLCFSVLAVALALGPALIIGFALPRRSQEVWVKCLLGLLRAFMALPTVVIGLGTFLFFSRQGPLGDLGLLFTGSAIVFGEFFLALPILTVLIHSSLEQLQPELRETALTLGANFWQCLALECRESQPGLTVAGLTAFGRCVTELGIATMVGGNIEQKTQTLSTAIAEKTSQGLFEQSLALGLLLLALGLGVSLLTSLLQGSRCS